MRAYSAVACVIAVGVVAFAGNAEASLSARTDPVPLSKLKQCYAGPVSPRGGCAYSGSTDVSFLLTKRQAGNGGTEVPIISLSTFALPCIGTHNAGRDGHQEPDYLQTRAELPINAKTDKFSYHGTVVNPWVLPYGKIAVGLTGKITSPTTARVTLTVHYKSCGTSGYKLRS